MTISSIPKLFVGLSIALILIFLGAEVAGRFVYHCERVEATVTSIEYVGEGGIFGRTTKVVRLDDGSVFEVGSLPDGLKEGQCYTLEYREPYFLASPYIVIVDECGGLLWREQGR